MKYRSYKKVGTRNRVWLICNEYGGLIEEFDGTKNQAEARAAELEGLNRAPSAGVAHAAFLSEVIGVMRPLANLRCSLSDVGISATDIERARQLILSLGGTKTWE